MSVRKTELDCRRARVAGAVTATILGTGISVTAGGKRGPYTVSVDRLNKAEMSALVAMLEAWRRGKVPEPGETQQ